MTTARDTEVVVVGAGLAGLVAARELRRLGHDCLVLEAAAEVGGRTRNGSLGGHIVDLGGTFVGADQERIIALARELGLGLTPTHTAGENLVLWRGKRRNYGGTIPRLDPVTLLSMAYLRGRLEALVRSVPLGSPWEAERSRGLDSQTLESWMRELGITSGARDLMRIGVAVSWGCEPSELSLLHVLHYLRGAGGLDQMLAVENGAQELHVDAGAQAISLRLAEELGDRLRLDAPVGEIAWDEGGVTVGAVGGAIRARRAVLALSPAMRAGIRFGPRLPGPWSEVPQRWFQGPVSKAYALYERPFWRDAGLSGEAISDAGPVTVTLDGGPPAASHGVLLGFVAADDARAWDGLPRSERRAQVLSCFGSLFGERALEPIDYVDQRWSTEAWTGGGSVAAASPYAWTACGRAIAAPIGPLHWAGTETSGRWTGFMEGAVRSGERVAAEVASTSP